MKELQVEIEDWLSVKSVSGEQQAQVGSGHVQEG